MIVEGQSDGCQTLEGIYVQSKDDDECEVDYIVIFSIESDTISFESE